MQHYELRTFEGVTHTVTPAIFEAASAHIRQILPSDSSFLVKLKSPEEMTIKELRDAINREGLTRQTRGFMEKSEYVNLLQGVYKSKGLL